MKIKSKLWNLKRIFKRAYSSLWQDSTDYLDAYSLDLEVSQPSTASLQSAKVIRGQNKPPSLMIYGVRPRAGTNFIGRLLSNHPDICAYPNDIYEIPFLCMTNKLTAFQDAFFGDYYRNIQQMKKNDFLPLFGASFISHLYSFVPENKTLLTKEPDVRYLRYFPTMFPHENLLLVLRDGRDVVHSTVTSWPDMDFKTVCQRWHDSAMLILEYQKKYRDQFLLIKYEDMLENPEKLLTEILNHYHLNPETYPFDSITDTPIIGSSTASNQGEGVSWKPIKANKEFKPTNKWLTWTPAQKKMFKDIAGESLLACQYCDNLDW